MIKNVIRLVIIREPQFGMRTQYVMIYSRKGLFVFMKTVVIFYTFTASYKIEIHQSINRIPTM